MQKKVIIKDRIYGTHIITEPLLIELLESKIVQRLKKISQFGIPDKYYHLKSFSRYEHSVGVMILIKTLGGSLEEQAAGLLHDVSHTAFSHIIDWVIGNEACGESYQDNHHKKIINSEEIKNILEKYDSSSRIISNYHNFSLLEKDPPDLCADRVDYALRELPIPVAKLLFKSLMNNNNEMIFKDKNSAYIFATNFLKLQKDHWGGFEAVSRYKLFSHALKLAIKEGTINLADFSENDQHVIKKLLKTKNPEIKAILKILSKKKMLFSSTENEITHKKFRHTDPKFMSSHGVCRLSDASSKFKDYFEKQKQHNEKGISVPIFSLK
ncbi:MAG: HD domain-containing protein [Candidatus Paceibacterota bacterium]